MKLKLDIEDLAALVFFIIIGAMILLVAYNHDKIPLKVDVNPINLETTFKYKGNRPLLQ